MPKKQMVKMGLNEFLQDEAFGSAPGNWADEEMPLPAANASHGNNSSAMPPRDTPMDWNASKRDFAQGPPADRFGGGFGARADRPPREPREPVPIPDKPPFTARLVNLDYSVTQEDIEQLFDESYGIVSIRVPQDNITGKPRGFAFVEFSDQSGLARALDLTGQNFINRELRVFVAEKASPAMDDRFVGDWRGGQGPLGPMAPPREPDNRDYNNWERRGPLPPLEREFKPRREGPPKPRSRMDERFMDMDWERKGPLATGSRNGSSAHGAGFDKPAVSRPKITLAPRTVGAHGATPDQAPESRSSLFGKARPIDTTKKLEEIEAQSKKDEQVKIDAARAHREKLQAQQDARKKREEEQAEKLQKRFKVLSVEGDEEEEDTTGNTVQETAPKSEQPKTEAEKILTADATQADLEGDDWEVVNKRRK